MKQLTITRGWLKLISVAVGFSFLLAGCGEGAKNSNDEDLPQVVSTSTIIADLTATIGGDEIAHQGILQPGADPHVYEPTPKDSVALEKADLILYNGFNLEPALIKMINSTGVQAKKYAVGEVVEPLYFEYQGQKQLDPHVWGDGELGQIDQWIIKQIATIPQNQRKLVTTHDAFQYFTTAYGLEMAGTLIGISTEEQPSAQTVKNLANSIKKMQIPAIFAETTINPQLIKTVAEEAGVKLAPQELYSDSIGAKGSEGDTYIKMLIANTKSIVESLGGNYEAFPHD